MTQAIRDALGRATAAIAALDAWRPGGSNATAGDYEEGRRLAGIAGSAAIDALRGDHGRALMEALKDAARLAFIANGCDAVNVNQWLVQVRPAKDDHWQCDHHAMPPKGLPVVLAASKLDALRKSLDSAIARQEPPHV